MKFGKEWKKELMQFKKSELVDMIANLKNGLDMFGNVKPSVQQQAFYADGKFGKNGEKKCKE